MNFDPPPQERLLRGIGVSPGICIGEITVWDEGNARIPRYRIAPYDVEAEILRLRQAIEATRHELKKLRNRLGRQGARQQLLILESHLLIVQDETLTEGANDNIRRNRWNAESALEDSLADFEAAFAGIDNDYLRDRTSDIRQVVRQVQHHLMGVQGVPSPQSKTPVIMVAHDLRVDHLLRFPRKQVLGIITELGGRTSHNAIIASALGIPAILGLHDVTRQIRNGDTAILDGTTGEVILHPTPDSLQQAAQRRRRHNEHQRALKTLRDQPCTTRDGVTITLRANISSVGELEAVRESGASGVGLYRTEYLYLNREDLPDEEEHYRVYRKVMEELAPQSAVIRMFDLGGDVIASSLESPDEPNPALGLRAIRLAFSKREVFKTQLRALLRASAEGPLKILYPFITNLEEIRAVHTLMEEVVTVLDAEGHSVSRPPPVGILVETPAAALLADLFSREVDFLTIGTNDLTQYTLAADRGNDQVSHLYDPMHPAVLRLIEGVIAAARRNRVAVSVCGEMAGDPKGAAVLVGMGIRELSMNPCRVPRIKECLRRITIDQAESWAKGALSCTSTEDVRTWMESCVPFESSDEKQIAIGGIG